MAQMLLINPRKRRAVKAKRRASPKRKTAARKTARRSYAANPIAVKSVKRRIRRAAPSAKRKSVRRRRNPISMGRKLNMSSITTMFKEALIGGAGAVGVDALMAQLNKYLPASMQPTAQPGLNNAVKAGLTVVLGSVLAKSTKGLSTKAAAGALAVQATDVIRYALARYMPTVPVTPPVTDPAVNGMGYASPAYITNGTARVGPSIRGVGEFTRGRSPMLSAFSPGSSVLSGANNARSREGAMR